jgi:hypothetical protein
MRVEKLRDRLVGLATRLSRTKSRARSCAPRHRRGHRPSPQVSIVEINTAQASNVPPLTPPVEASCESETMGTSVLDVRRNNKCAQ